MDGHTHKAEANRLTEELRKLVRRSGSITGGELAAAIVRMLRERAACWERAGEVELYGECHAIADLIEGKAVGFEKQKAPPAEADGA